VCCIDRLNPPSEADPYERTQLAAALRCAHMILAKPRWLVPSKLSNPCSSFESNRKLEIFQIKQRFVAFNNLCLGTQLR